MDEVAVSYQGVCCVPVMGIVSELSAAPRDLMNVLTQVEKKKGE